MAASTDFALVMPMAGQGSRFSADGSNRPKPLIPLGGRPFFWWATESVKRAIHVRELVYVVLDEHVSEHRIDDVIHGYYPDARVVSLPVLTGGAADSAAAGVAALHTSGPFAVNDCDHAFLVDGLPDVAAHLAGDAQGALLGFRSTSPAYSYAVLDERGMVTRTVEKEVVSPFAIAGCYLFAERAVYLESLALYRAECEYPELFLSGVFNVMIRRGADVLFRELALHVPFGTPRELALVSPEALAILRAGRG